MQKTQQQLADQQAGKTPPQVVRKLADSTFCWMVYKVGVEDELVEYMHRNGIGAFACDSHAVFSYFDLSDLREAKCKYGQHRGRLQGGTQWSPRPAAAAGRRLDGQAR